MYLSFIILILEHVFRFNADPFSTKRSLTRSVNNPHNLDFITDCFKIGYLYFGTVQTTQGPTVIKIIVPDSPAPGKAHQQVRRWL